MVMETPGEWLRAFLRIGLPGILLAVFLAWLTLLVSRALESRAVRKAAAAAQRRVLRGSAPIRHLTFPRYNRGLAIFFLALALLMLLLWAGKLCQLLLS